MKEDILATTSSIANKSEVAVNPEVHELSLQEQRLADAFGLLGFKLEKKYPTYEDSWRNKQPRDVKADGNLAGMFHASNGFDYPEIKVVFSVLNNHGKGVFNAMIYTDGRSGLGNNDWNSWELTSQIQESCQRVGIFDLNYAEFQTQLEQLMNTWDFKNY